MLLFRCDCFYFFSIGALVFATVGIEFPLEPQEEFVRDMTGDGVLVAERARGDEKRPDRKPKPVAGDVIA